MKNRFTKFDWRTFRLLYILGIGSFIAIFPYLIELQKEQLSQLEVSLPFALFMSTIQTGVLLTFILLSGIYLVEKNGFGLNFFQKKTDIRNQKKELGLAITLGGLAGFGIILLDYLFGFILPVINAPTIALWKSLLASFYGGIFEEILLRLFFLSFLVWGLSKVIKPKFGKPRPGVVWAGILFAAIVFGLGHLPATALLTEITPMVVVRAIVLNGVGAVVYGWLFWRKGLLLSMIAHYTTDITLLILFPLLMNVL